MPITPDPLKAQATRELVKLARRLARNSERRRKLVRQVAELEAELRTDRRLMRELADSIGADVEPPSIIAAACYCDGDSEPHAFGDPLVCAESKIGGSK